MATNLLDLVKSQFNSDFISKAATALGENQSNLSNAVSSIIPTVFSGIISKATANNTGAETIFNMAKQTSNGGLFGNVMSLVGDADLLNKGGGLLTNVFGDKTSSIINAISAFSGIKNSSASSLMSMAAPTVMSSIGKFTSEHNLSADGLKHVLNEQKGDIMRAMPAGLSTLTGMLGIGGLSNIASNAGGKAEAAAAKVEAFADKKPGTKWLLPLLLLAGVGILGWWFLFGNKNKQAEADVNTTTVSDVATADSALTDGTTTSAVATIAGKMDSITGEFIFDEGKQITLDLPNNAGKLVVGENSTEARLVSFLSDASKTIDTVKGNWFEFTNVKFKTGRAEITDASLTQLKNMVAIAKAYPSAQFKLGGYTDNAGDSIKNVVLSQKRADVVAAKLKQLGASSNSIISAKGYGPQWPIADNATAEGKAMNRRVAVNVKAK